MTISHADQAVAFALGSEELLYLLRLLQLPTIPGVAPVEDVSERDMRIALRAAEHSLMARGILQFEAPKLGFDTFVAGVLSQCARPPAFSVVQSKQEYRLPPEQNAMLQPPNTEAIPVLRQSVSLYHPGDLCVKHSARTYGIHGFVIFPNMKALLADMTQMVTGSIEMSERHTTFEMRLSFSILEHLLSDTARQQSDREWLDYLTSQGVNPRDAQLLIDDLRYQVKSTSVISAWGSSESILLLVQKNDGWLVFDSVDADEYAIRWVVPSQLHIHLARFIDTKKH